MNTKKNELSILQMLENSEYDPNLKNLQKRPSKLRVLMRQMLTNFNMDSRTKRTS